MGGGRGLFLRGFGLLIKGTAMTLAAIICFPLLLLSPVMAMWFKATLHGQLMDWDNWRHDVQIYQTKNGQ